jgi:hypothetical protein
LGHGQRQNRKSFDWAAALLTRSTSIGELTDIAINRVSFL